MVSYCFLDKFWLEYVASKISKMHTGRGTLDDLSDGFGSYRVRVVAKVSDNPHKKCLVEILEVFNRMGSGHWHSGSISFLTNQLPHTPILEQPGF